jgi:predicted enzyme related to lactoylglutathione lyase
MKKRISGIGGIFFKSADPKKLQAWYDKHLGLSMTGSGYHSFLWKDTPEPEKGRTEFSIFNNTTDYLNPSTSSFMINFRVENLVELLQVLKEEGVTQVGNMDEYSYGKFAWIMDPDGNKIELWEPVDDGF